MNATNLSTTHRIFDFVTSMMGMNLRLNIFEGFPVI